ARPRGLPAVARARLGDGSHLGALLDAVVFEQIAVWPAQGRCRVRVRSADLPPPHVRARLEGELAACFTHLRQVEVEWTGPGADDGTAAPVGAGGADGTAPPEPACADARGEEAPPADGLPAPEEWEDDDDYARRLAAYAQQGPLNGLASRTPSAPAPADDSPVIRGKPIAAEPVPIRTLDELPLGGDPVTLRGQIMRTEVKELRRGQRMVEFDI